MNALHKAIVCHFPIRMDTVMPTKCITYRELMSGGPFIVGGVLYHSVLLGKALGSSSSTSMQPKYGIW